jgi:hypothetical protein
MRTSFVITLIFLCVSVALNGYLTYQIILTYQQAQENTYALYYDPLQKQRYDINYLRQCLGRWQWIKSAYEEFVFDCSEMSAYLEMKLENEGFHTIIAWGESPNGNGYHSWLLVEISEEKYVPVEATSVKLVNPTHQYYDEYFDYEFTFETIQDALAYSYEDYNWWDS